MRTKNLAYHLLALPVVAATLLSASGGAAATETELNVIALPHDWCNYGGVIEAFRPSIPISRSMN
jgi:putative spermidine/putrescine transport system substrate-binding protein